MYNNIDPIKNCVQHSQIILTDLPFNIIVKRMKIFLETPLNRNEHTKNLIVVASVLND